jgi:hypothetical protein
MRSHCAAARPSKTITFIHGSKKYCHGIKWYNGIGLAERIHDVKQPDRYVSQNWSNFMSLTHVKHVRDAETLVLTNFRSEKACRSR